MGKMVNSEIYTVICAVSAEVLLLGEEKALRAPSYYLFVTMLLLPLSQSPGAEARRSLFLLVSSGTSRLTIRFAK